MITTPVINAHIHASAPDPSIGNSMDPIIHALGLVWASAVLLLICCALVGFGSFVSKGNPDEDIGDEAPETLTQKISLYGVIFFAIIVLCTTMALPIAIITSFVVT